jgi:hypothetical protein
MGRFGRHRVENELAWPHEAPKLLSAYERLFQGRRAPQRGEAARSQHLQGEAPTRQRAR